MNQFKGFEEFNFFRAINPGFHVGTAEKRPGIVVGDQESFQGYKELYDCEFSISLELQQPPCHCTQRELRGWLNTVFIPRVKR